jgi:hypothetical protein
MPETDNIVLARVTEPTFINNVLHMPGEIAYANLTELGVEKIGADTPGLEPYDGQEPAKPAAPSTPFPIKLGTDAFVGLRNAPPATPLK